MTSVALPLDDRTRYFDESVRDICRISRVARSVRVRTRTASAPGGLELLRHRRPGVRSGSWQLEPLCVRTHEQPSSLDETAAGEPDSDGRGAGGIDVTILAPRHLIRSALALSDRKFDEW